MRLPLNGCFGLTDRRAKVSFVSKTVQPTLERLVEHNADAVSYFLFGKVISACVEPLEQLIFGARITLLLQNFDSHSRALDLQLLGSPNAVGFSVRGGLPSFIGQTRQIACAFQCGWLSRRIVRRAKHPSKFEHRGKPLQAINEFPHTSRVLVDKDRRQ